MPVFKIKAKSNKKETTEIVNKDISTGIHKYTVTNPVTDPRLPFFDKRKGIFYVPLKAIYRYYVACKTLNTDGGYDYHILLSKDKFDKNCRLCHTDDYGRVQIKVKGEIAEYILSESVDRGNVEVTYVESTIDYDVFEIT